MAQWLKAQEHHHAANSVAPPENPLLKNRQPEFFSREDFAALEAFTEILIPTDDTPGAKEAHCAHFIDFLMTASEGMPVQRQWRDAMAALKKLGFHDADAKGRAELVAATRALDRVLLWNFYVVPQFTYGFSRYARWDRFSHAELPKYARSGLPSLWWFDADKAAKIGKRS